LRFQDSWLAETGRRSMQTARADAAQTAWHPLGCACDPKAYFGTADFFAELLKFKVLPRNNGFRRRLRP
jgi:hypothetical protein